MEALGQGPCGWDEVASSAGEEGGRLEGHDEGFGLIPKDKKKKATEELERVHLDMMRIRICKRHFRLQCGAGIRTEL